MHITIQRIQLQSNMKYELLVFQQYIFLIIRSGLVALELLTTSLTSICFGYIWKAMVDSRVGNRPMPYEQWTTPVIAVKG